MTPVISILVAEKIRSFVTAMSAEASDMRQLAADGTTGEWLISSGICDASWTAIGLAISTLFKLADRGRNASGDTAKDRSIALPDFFARPVYRDEFQKLFIGIS